jgi:beta-N-acetylhexosaminidase
VLTGSGLVAAAVLIVATGGCALDDRAAGPGHDEHAAKVASARAAARKAHPRAVLGLSPERAAARLMLVGFAGTGADAQIMRRLRQRDFGGMVVGSANYVDDVQLASLVDAIGTAARKAHHAPPVVFANSLPVTMATLHGAHVGATFGPVADLKITGGPHETDAFSDDPVGTATAVQRAVALRSAAGVASAVGHFPGDGSASDDPELVPATVGSSLDALRRSDLVPFKRVARHVSAVMMSDALYAAFDGVTPATELPEAVKLLRDLGFHGVVVSGDLSAAAQVGGSSVGDAAVAALRAGCDLLYVPGDVAAQEQTYRAITRAIRRGTVPAGRAAAALRRVALLQRAHG